MDRVHRVALATCRDFPQLDPSEALLLAALERLGARAEAVVWEDTTFDWSSVDLCVIRSTWDYPQKFDAFVAWVDRVSGLTRLVNSARVVRWNTHKGYLRDLEEAGVHVVPTAWVRAGEPAHVGEIVQERGWREIVVKPAVSGNARDTIRTSDMAVANAQIERITRGGVDAMIQPYLPSVEGRGERSLVYFGGVFSHAIRKHAVLEGGARLGGEPLVEPDQEELAFGTRALAAVGEPLAYARVDIARDDAGAIALMELELVEPSLFFAQAPGSADRLAHLLLAR